MYRTVLLVALLASSLAAADDLDARLKQGAELAARGEVAAARALFEELAVQNPHRPEPLNDLAALYAAAGELSRARALLERALATDPSYRAVHDNLAALYAAEAGAAYRRALPLDGAPPANPSLMMLTRMPGTAVASTPSTTMPVAGTATAAPKVSVAPKSTIAPPATRAADPFDARAAAVFGAVDAWLRAWSHKDVDGYTSAYGPEFVPPDGLSRAAWETQRALRIRAPKQIAITIHDRNLVIDRDGTHARMTFAQRYRSDRFNGDSFKTLTLVEHDGRWRISAERTGR